MAVIGDDPNLGTASVQLPGYTTYDTAIPGTAQIMSATEQAKRAYQNALARLNNTRSSALRDWGYTAEFDPTSGVVKNMRVDPNNPFGQYQGFRNSHAYGLMDAEDALQSRGISGRGGLGLGQINRLRRGYQAEDQAFTNTVLRQLASFQDEQNQAKYDYDAALWQAQLAAAQNAASSGDWSDPMYDDPYTDDGSTVTQDGPAPVSNVARQVARPMPSAAQRRRNSNAVIRQSKKVAASPKKLQKYGWGAAAVVAKAQKKPAPAPKKQEPKKKKPTPRAWGPR